MTDSRIIERAGAYYIRAEAVLAGDLLDFEGDSIVDPNGLGELFDPTPPASVTILWAEFASVENVERETASCVRIDTDQGSYGFPVDHLIETTLANKRGELIP